MAKGDRAAREQKSDGRQDQPNECRRRRAAASVGIRRSGHAATANIAAAEHQSTAVVRNTAAPRAYDRVTAWLVGRDMTVRSSIDRVGISTHAVHDMRRTAAIQLRVSLYERLLRADRAAACVLALVAFRLTRSLPVRWSPRSRVVGYPS